MFGDRASPCVGSGYGRTGIFGQKTESGWFAARPSGTEDVYKIYAESFQGPERLARIQQEAKDLVSEVLKQA